MPGGHFTAVTEVQQVGILQAGSLALTFLSQDRHPHPTQG